MGIEVERAFRNFRPLGMARFSSHPAVHTQKLAQQA